MSRTLEALRALDPPTVAIIGLVAIGALLVVSDPILGRRQHRALLAELPVDPAGPEAVRLRFYRSWVRQGWLWAAAMLGVVVATPGIGLTDLGLRWPDLRFEGLDGIGGSIVTGMVGGLAGGVVLTAVAASLPVVRRRLPRMAGKTAVVPMLPTSPRGRRGWAGLAITAGVTEELTYRGLLILVIALVAPAAQAIVVVAIAGVLFGLAHAYQGRAGMLATGVLGCAFAGVYLATGSLLIGMVLHLLIDLRPLVMGPAPR